MAVIIVAEALFCSIGTVIELADVDLSVLCYPGVDDSVGHLRVSKFHYY
jgi:hypothetical protein